MLNLPLVGAEYLLRCKCVAECLPRLDTVGLHLSKVARCIHLSKVFRCLCKVPRCLCKLIHSRNSRFSKEVPGDSELRIVCLLIPVSFPSSFCDQVNIRVDRFSSWLGTNSYFILLRSFQFDCICCTLTSINDFHSLPTVRWLPMSMILVVREEDPKLWPIRVE